MAMQISRRNIVAGAATVGAMAAFGMAGCSSKGSGKAESKAEEYDIVIVGAGGAGMSAAIAAHDAGVEKVVVLEKEGNVGGNTNFSSSGMNASETKFQKAQGIDDSNELFAQETLDGGHDTGNPELVHFMCDNSAGAIDWLDGLGITLDNITMTGGMSVKRCHRPTDGSAVGKTIVPGLQKAVEDRGIEIKTNCDVKELVQADDGSITGVKTDKGDYSAKAVILAAGGFINAGLAGYAQHYGLSARETEVLRMVLEGKDNQNIAGELSLAASTVKVHVHNILKKTAQANRQELMRDFRKMS